MATSKTQVSWTKDEVALLHECRFLSIANLGLLIPRHSETAIRCHRRRLGIYRTATEKSELGRKARAYVDEDKLCNIDQSLTLDSLDEFTWQLIIGSILGDGCIKGPDTCRNKQFYEGHGVEQRTYVQWKRDNLLLFHPTVVTKDHEFSTCYHPMFTVLRKWFYSPNRKPRQHKDQLPPHIFDRLDLFGLLIWYLDDGTTGRKRLQDFGQASPSLSICAHAWPYEHLQCAVTKLNQRFGLKLHVTRYKWKNSFSNCIQIPAASRDVLIPQWQQMAVYFGIPSCMNDKLLVGWKWKRKLNEEKVRAIRADNRTHEVIAKEYGVTASNIWRVQKRRTWKHVI